MVELKKFNAETAPLPEVTDDPASIFNPLKKQAIQHYCSMYLIRFVIE